MDRQSVYTLSMFDGDRRTSGQETVRQIQQELIDFILEFHLDNVFIYRYVKRWHDVTM
jgi:DNA replication licensing factor MCM5